ncbi:hypothetical protein FHR90_000812 [Endobacter medicaginis]|uniref:Glycosyltransferase family 2 protein n=1 Tax=Endobacter medicaginis TaxID=1181271 RepID=A0A850NS92_9PROT|nr:glycosyltransferase family 2 protein [Endobacter medicaginis]MBB3172994.1 hypothetical protein [Endobacter medicaginis]MCX5475226.1 glycosyltransferase family 2 protein [Endobacter medicaginis]NVN31100.1 glycosyltransferase family 2 protein [Endobacter medicaginis]
MASVLVVTMQRDEGAMLSRWLAHYASLFSMTNLAIVDNGSTDTMTLELLGFAERSGARVLRHYATDLDFLEKGRVVTEVIHTLEADAHRRWQRYDFIIPVDCDELLGVFTRDGVSLTPDDIHAEFHAWRGIDRVLRVGMSLFNVPGQDGWFSPNRSFHKGIVPGGELMALDKGFHSPVLRSGDAHERTRLTYLHYHNAPFAVLRRKARLKLQEPYAACTDLEQLRRYARDPAVPGNHLIADLLLTEAEYEAIYDHELRIMVNPASPTLLYSPAGLVRWDAEAYLALNPDVREYGLGPLEHYVACGWTEGRALSPAAAMSG